jgi:saccharopine dehydrogenase-like NADP-dependent oxidoreductase
MITVVGAGNIGMAIVDYLSDDFDVSVIDISEKALKNLRGVKKFKGKVKDHADLVKRSEIIITALPGSASFETISSIIKMGKSVVDVSYMEEDPFLLDNVARENRVFLIPDAGFAPGLSNVLSGYLYKKIDGIKKIEIYVGGLPRERIPPLDYAVTWSVEGLIDEYTRPARIIKNYKIKTVDPLESVEPFCISNIGTFETFISDGLRTMLKTFKIRDMFERTLRYPSHIEKIKLLRDLGFFSKDKINGCSPYEVTISLFERLRIDVEDMSILLVRGHGKRVEDLFIYDRYDEKSGITSMARMTGYTAASVATIALEMDEYGVVPPEYFGMDGEYFLKLREKLRKKGIIINETLNL